MLQKSKQLNRAEQNKRTLGDSKPKFVDKSKNLEQRKGRQQDASSGRSKSSKQTNVAVKLGVKSELLEYNRSTARNMGKAKKGLKRKLKTKFEEYLDLDMKNAGIFAEEDLEMEKRLAKKLKLKGGKLKGMDDGMNMLFKGIPSVLDSFDNDEEVRNDEEDEEFPIEKVENGTSSKELMNLRPLEEFSEDEIDDDVMEGVSELQESSVAEVELEKDANKKPSRKIRRKRKKPKKKQDVASDTADGVSEPAETHDAKVTLEETPAKSLAMAGSVKYVAPHLRSRAGHESEEHTKIRRRVRGMELSFVLTLSF